jgi:hypothetical protein
MNIEKGVDASEQAEFIVSTQNKEAETRAIRLKQAVKDHGGATAVARRSGVPLSTLNHHLLGREMKISTAAAIAAACNVTTDWLAGIAVTDTPKTAADSAAKPAELALAERPAAPSTPAQQERDLYQSIDRERLGRAARFAIRQFERHNREPSDYGIGQIVALIYDTPGASLEEFEEMIDWSMRPAR